MYTPYKVVVISNHSTSVSQLHRPSKARKLPTQQIWVTSVEKQDPAPVDKQFIPLFARVYTSQAVHVL